MLGQVPGKIVNSDWLTGGTRLVVLLIQSLSATETVGMPVHMHYGQRLR